MVRQFGHIAKWKLNSLLIPFFVILLLIPGCQTTKQTPQITVPFAGDYPILKLRQIWGFCLANFQRNTPYTPPPLIIQMCDCYVDEIRKTYPNRKVDKLSDNESKKLGQKLARMCNINIGIITT